MNTIETATIIQSELDKAAVEQACLLYTSDAADEL